MNAIRCPGRSEADAADSTESAEPAQGRACPPSSIPAIRGSPNQGDGRRGAALPLAMGVVVVLTLLGAGLLGSAGSSRLDAIRRQQSLQCFWGAESVLAIARQRLFTDSGYRDAPTDVALTNGMMRANAAVVKAGNLFTVTARGSNTSTRVDRRICQDFQLQEFGYWDDFALFAGKGGAEMQQSVSVYGDVFVEGDVKMQQAAAIFEGLYCQGDLDMSQSAVIYDEAYIGGSISLKQSSTINGGSYPFSSPANPYYIVQPTVPTLDPTYYNSLLAIASVSNSGLNFNNSINLAGQVKYVNGGATLQQVKTLTSTPGGGILVVKDSFNIQQSCQIGPNVSVICGNTFTMQQSTRIGTNALIYAGVKIEMQQSGIVASKATIATPGNLVMKQAAQASGFIYAGGELDLSQSVAIQGLCYAGDKAKLQQSVMLTYSKSVLPMSFPPGIQTNGAVSMTPQKWREL